MVVFSSYYIFSAEEVECIMLSDSGIGSHPFRLTVRFKSGKDISVNYGSFSERKEAMNDLARKIEREKRFEAEQTSIALNIIKDSINRIDKRQLRIWQQLKALLGVEGDLNGN